MSGLWPLLWRALRRRPLRSALTVLAVALGIAAVLGVEITVDAVDSQAAEAQQQSAGGSGLDVRVDTGTGLTAAQVQTLAQLPGVLQAVPLYEKRVVASPVGPGFNGVAVTLVGLSDGSAALRSIDVVSGRLPRPGSRSEVAIDSGLAQALPGMAGETIYPGQHVQLITATGPDLFTVVGLTRGTAGGPSFTRSAVFADDAAMLGAFRLGLQTPLVALHLAPAASVDTVSAEVHSALGTEVTTFDPRATGSAPLADLRPLLALTTVLSVLIGAGVTANSTALAVLERRREIGLLRAAGASPGQVFRLFSAETAVLTLCAVPVGIALGVAMGAVLDSVFTPAGLPPTPLSVGAGQVAAAVGAGLCCALAGGLMPALLAARLPVLSALRSHPTQSGRTAHPVVAGISAACVVAALICFARGGSGFAAAGAACFLLAMVCALPVIAPVLAGYIGRASTPFVAAASAAAGNLTRNRNRTALTVAGLSVSIAVAVAMSALTLGALSESDGWVSHLFVGDTVLTSSVTQRAEVETAIARSPGVDSVSPVRIFAEPVAGVSVGVAAIEPTVYLAHGGLDVITPDRQTALDSLQQRGNVLAPEGLAAAAGWSVGTQLTVQTTTGTVQLTITGIVSHSFPAGDGSETLVMSTDEAQQTFGAVAGGFDDLLLFTDSGTQSVAGTAAEYGLRAVSVGSIESAADSAVQHSIGLLTALAAVAVMIAVLAVVNTLVVNVRLGTRELALLRAVGLARRQALRVVLAECGLLALTAALIGVATGCVIAFPLLAASGTPGFAPGFVFPLAVALVLAAAVVLSAVVATLGPALRATRVSVLTALHQE